VAGSSASSAPLAGATGATGAAGSSSDLAGAGGAPSIPDPPGTVSITTDEFLLKAGNETYKCQNFDNPFGGKDTAIQRVVNDMSPGSHHLHLYHMATTSTRTLEDCTSSDFHPLMFTASSPHNELAYPAGMAAKLTAAQGLRVQLHYINSTDKDIMVKATLKLSPVDVASVTKWVSELYFNQLGVKVAPGAGQTVTTTCAIPDTYGPIGLVAGYTHMHKRGVHFVAQTSTGAMLADVDSWDEPPTILYDTPIMLNPGDKITWTCTYNNDTGRTLTFGESAETNEMCIYLARFFSAPDGAQLECQANGATGMTTSRTY
jgi:Copper type II ascorbate-dependent monooxygenase, C-terminal domain